MRIGHLYRLRYDDDLRDWDNNYDEHGWWIPRITAEERERDIRRFVEELKIAPTLDSIFVTSSTLKKLVNKLRPGRHFLTRKDLVDVASPIHKTVMQLFGKNALIEETEYQICKHCVVSRLRRCFTTKLFLLITTAFADLKRYECKKELSAANHVLERLHTRSIVRSALTNRLPPLTRITLQKIGTSLRQLKSLESRTAPFFIQIPQDNRYTSWSSTVESINRALTRSGVSMTHTCEQQIYPDIYSALHDNGGQALKTK